MLSPKTESTAAAPIRVQARPSGTQGGFTLVELMVALVVGLIVTGAAISFVVSIAGANSDNIRTTRLTQELRSVSEVISREVRRSRYVADPIGNVAQGAASPFQNDSMIGSVPGTGNTFFTCLALRYDRPPTETSGSLQRSIYLSNGRVMLSNQADCTGGTAISSAEVTITRLSFDNDLDSTNALPAVPASPASNMNNFVRVGVTGRLTTASGNLASLARTFQQDIYIRSGKVN
ncbi:MAG TPA: prepilin-type N-terminal cleavage/methylation domain-containing protein [Lysobacter sp.]